MAGYLNSKGVKAANLINIKKIAESNGLSFKFVLWAIIFPWIKFFISEMYDLYSNIIYIVINMSSTQYPYVSLFYLNFTKH